MDAVAISSTAQMDDGKMSDLPKNHKTRAMMPLTLKRIKKNMTTQQTIWLWSSKHTATIISEMFGGVLL